MTSVAHVTGVAHALPRTTPDPGPTSAGETASAVPAGAPGPLPTTGAVIRAVPAVRPDPEPPASTESDAPDRRRGRAERGPGRREVRRQETRARIVDSAADLFAERGFDAVSVRAIAKRAGVVEKTVFNHFPVKESLVFDADPPMRAALLDAVRRRPAGESVSAAAGDFVVSAIGRLGSPEATAGVARMARIIRGSRVLQVREREILGELTDSLARLIAAETGARPGQVEPWLAAHAVLGLYASLLELTRDRVLEGLQGSELTAELLRQGRRGLSLLQFGLAGYAKRR